MSAPRWTRWLLARLAPADREDDVVGDLEEAHRARVDRRGRLLGSVLTGFDALDMAWALVRDRGTGPKASWLDFKLGLRMLVKYPGLTTLGGLSMAFAIFTAAGAFEFISQVVAPDLPLPDGDRVVGVRVWDAANSRGESRTLYDLGVWREELGTLDELGAFRTVRRNLVTADGGSEPVLATVIDAEAFGAARVAPALGRPIVEADEGSGASPVVVVGHDLWRERLGGDPDAVGSTVRLGGTPTTIVGVMPEGFGYPFASDLWVPLSAGAAVDAPLEGPGVTVVGRLAEGASMEDTRNELAVMASRLATAHPTTHRHLRPQVLPFAHTALGLPASISSTTLAALGLVSNVPLVLFLVLICGNVALLTFARAASRESELAVRSALGASRGRIILQLFVEALVLAALAAVVGLAAAQYGLGWILRIIESVFLEGGELPFWFHANLSATTVLYAALLTVVAAGVAGVLPALKVTRSLSSRLQRSSAGGGGFRFGGVWTVVIVLQIAVTMVFPVLTLATRSQSEQELGEDLAIADDRYLTARIVLDRPDDPDSGVAPEAVTTGENFSSVARRLEERLEAEPRVTGVAFAERLPRQYHPWRQIEVDGPMAEPPDARGHRMGSAAVSVDYFDVMDADVLAGRTFQAADLTGDPGVVVVNRSFVERVLGGRNAVGQRVRYLATEEYRDPDQEPGPWHEIVGVVEDLGTISGYGPAGIYHPAAPGDLQPVSVALQVRGEPAAFAPALRSMAAEVDPALRVHDVVRMDEITRGQKEFFAFWTVISGGVSALALLLSLGGIFAVMSYTVARRTREIGLRMALGSSRRQVVTSIFRRPLAQIVMGVVTGGVLLTLLFTGLGQEEPPDAGTVAFLVGYVVLMAGVCLLACVPPTLRALSIEPAQALQVDG